MHPHFQSLFIFHGFLVSVSNNQLVRWSSAFFHFYSQQKYSRYKPCFSLFPFCRPHWKGLCRHQAENQWPCQAQRVAPMHASTHVINACSLLPTHCKFCQHFSEFPVPGLFPPVLVCPSVVPCLMADNTCFGAEGFHGSFRWMLCGQDRYSCNANNEVIMLTRGYLQMRDNLKIGNWAKSLCSKPAWICFTHFSPLWL